MTLVLLLACVRSPGDSGDVVTPTPLDGRLLVSDLRGNQWFTADPNTGEVEDSFLLSTLEPEVCTGEENERYCLLFQSREHIALDGSDEILFTYSALDVSDGDDDSKTDLIARVYSVDRATHEPRWHIDALDFSHLTNGSDYCPFDPGDPCHPSEAMETRDYWACSLHMTHDMVVTAEDESSVSMWLVDSRNSRMLHVTSPRDGTCAVVDTVLDDHVEDWDIYNSNNSMQLWQDGDDENLLMSVKNSFPDDQTGESQFGGPGRGKIILWRRNTATGSPWAQVWEFPPVSETEESFLDDPHGVDTIVDDSGHRYALFAHSLGHSDGPDYGEGTGGSIGVVRIDDDAPVYVFDVLLPGADVLQFPRDVTPLPDGSWLFTDSGCLGDGCAYETADWIVRLPEFQPSEGFSGAWRPDHGQQQFVEAEVLRGPMFQPANLLFSSAYIGG